MANRPRTDASALLNDAATQADTQQGQTDAAPPSPAPAHTVRYVVNRPYSAGEPYDIVTASVVKEHDDQNVLDLAYGDQQAEHVRRSDRQEPGTWHQGGE